VLCGTEVEALRIHEDAVVVPKDGLDHPGAFPERLLVETPNARATSGAVSAVSARRVRQHALGPLVSLQVPKQF
jgi:hypothetical protein